jgi:hypothetical protein
MAEIVRTLNAEKRPSFNYRTTLELLAEQLCSERCLIFLGAGASIDQDKPDLPTAKELSKEMARKCMLDWHEYVPLSTTAFYFEFFYTREKLNQFLVERIGDPRVQPTSTITTLVKIVSKLEALKKKCIVVTTNYDQHFERAYTAATGGRQPGVIVYRGANDPNIKGSKLHDGLNGEPEYWLPDLPTYLYKMHGCISNPGEQNLVITEEDYINFLTNALHHHPDKRLLHYVRGRLALSTVLFIGYSLSDWNFRVLFKATAEDKAVTSFAVQLNSDPGDNETERARQSALLKFWGKRHIDIVNTDAALFMDDLLDQVDIVAERRS